jgi:excisionase family DNA binding protein
MHIDEGPLQPLVVGPNTAQIMLSCGLNEIYRLIHAGDLESYKEGKSRKITTASIRRYVDRRAKAAAAKLASAREAVA